MPYTIALTATGLYRVTTGGVGTALTLPSDVSIVSGRKPRMAVLDRNVIITNAFNRSILVDPDFNVYPLQLQPPMSAAVLSDGASGSLSGTFRVKYTYVIKNANGKILVESGFSPISAAYTISSKLLKVTVSKPSDTSVTHIKIYRTLTNGTTYFPWIEIDGRDTATASSALSDASLALIAAPTSLGSAPGMIPGSFMTQCVMWKRRLWGVGSEDTSVDKLRHTDVNMPYAWKSTFEHIIHPVGWDSEGVTALIPRRDELGVFKRHFMSKIIGDTAANFEPVIVRNGKGCFAPNSAVVIDDVAYFLGEDGVYTWGPSGFDCISDGRVRKWFNTTTYFNRAQFSNAFAKYNHKYHGYELHLAAAGSSNIDRWVFYDIARRKWWGPHLTTKFTPTCALGQFIDTNFLTTPIVGGSDGKIYTSNSSTFADDGDAISVQADTGRMCAETPDIEKMWHGPSFIFTKQAAAGNLSVACKTGAREASTTRTLSITQTNTAGRQRFSPLGRGVYNGFSLTESTLNQGCEIQGFEIMTHELGRR